MGGLHARSVGFQSTYKDPHWAARREKVHYPVSKPAVAVARRPAVLEPRVRLVRLGRLLLDAGAVA